MSGLFYTLLGLAASSSLHCAVRREISPCTCRQEDFAMPPGSTPINNPIPGNGDPDILKERIEVDCERMESFSQLAQALTGKFTPEQSIVLRVSHSQLKDISKRGFKELRMVIKNLELNHNNLGVLDEEIFAGMDRTQYLSLADNEVPAVPRHILSHLPLLRTLDLSRNRINRIDADDFKYNPTLYTLLMAGNSISEMVPGSLPPLIKYLHIGRNHLKSLNRTLRDLNQLEWLLVNSNELTSLDGQLPSSGHNLKMLYAVDNKLTHLPPEFRLLHRLESLYLQHNRISSLNGTLQRARSLKLLELSYNDLQVLNEDDFIEASRLEDLQLAHNNLKSLGGDGSLNPDGTTSTKSAFQTLKSLKNLNLTHNDLHEFSFSSIRGLQELRLLDLSSNKISKLHRGRTPAENLVEEEGDETAGSSIQDLRLEHNALTNLEGSLFLGMKELQKLNLSHNALGPSIQFRDLRGLEGLRVLDLSHNGITSLEDRSEMWLPSLEELYASHNQLTTLSERDFRAFPGLCWVDVSANEITTVKPELVVNTRCTVHGVPDVLRIYLQDNPVLCDAALADLTVALEVNHAKIYGVANDCPTSPTPSPVTETTTPLPSLSPTLLLAAAAAASGGNVSFAATLE